MQPKGKKAKGKKVAPAPAVVKKQETKKVVNPLFEKRPKNFGIGESTDIGRRSVTLGTQLLMGGLRNFVVVCNTGLNSSHFLGLLAVSRPLLH